ncbi:MAG: L-threonylcarbamoyladenylate synthase [Alphaproteobacteria bacterium]|jgi:L-threonylcarbamoyladenylate synthase|nr:L-threonylcarbamoyladenylate synthase [Alphaproteobacteria bacterium]MDP6564516.1 L-threonylcarbamoyladenylate synthase [Alphaproteobacteria bacterium]
MNRIAARVRRADDADAVAEAVALLAAGELVAFPTETVYGLGADATNAVAVARIFAAKERPAFNPLIAHLDSIDGVAAQAVWNRPAEDLARAFWPGALTLVLPRRADGAIAEITCAGLDSVALRVPSHPGAHELLRAIGRPIAAPSANRSGRISPTRAEHVADEMGDRVALILDGGPCRIGLESTVVGFREDRPVLLRPGGVPLEDLREAVGEVEVWSGAAAQPRSPGQMQSHYAPRKPLRLNAAGAEPGESLLGFAATPGASADLSPTGDLVEAAANLFDLLRQLDQGPGEAIAVAAIPEGGLGRAINDRLRRAATAQD